MTLHYEQYSIGLYNRKLNHGRILWDYLDLAIPAGAGNPDNMSTDYPFQRWLVNTGSQTVVMTLDAAYPCDTIALAAHSLGTASANLTVRHRPATSGAWATAYDGTPDDDSTIAIMFNAVDGQPVNLRQIEVTVNNPGPLVASIGIFRAGVALQMERPVYGNLTPLGFSREFETQGNQSEKGEWLGTVVFEGSFSVSRSWSNNSADWVRETFEPFYDKCLERPFVLIDNALRMPEGVAWCWTNRLPNLSNQGTRDLMQISMQLQGRS